jgi:hypothetical protein
VQNVADNTGEKAHPLAKIAIVLGVLSTLLRIFSTGFTLIRTTSVGQVEEVQPLSGYALIRGIDPTYKGGHHSANDSQPAFSADGKKMAFAKASYDEFDNYAAVVLPAPGSPTMSKRLLEEVNAATISVLFSERGSGSVRRGSRTHPTRGVTEMPRRGIFSETELPV